MPALWGNQSSPNAKTGQPLLEYQHPVPVHSVAFSPDGQTVLTGSEDKLARLWSVPRPAADEPNRLRLSVEVRTGYYLDTDGNRRELTQAQWLERRQQLDEIGGFCDIRTWDQVSEAEKQPLRTPPKKK